ncbi:hypothetical protein Hsar01_02117 [Haloferula sargassicola]|uniref:Uncharacterized protein n=1 Tax=Haloferula sargassicola TaxID=490096 RepID=A0ABP9UN92_9BACT
MQIDLPVKLFANGLARVPTLKSTNSVGQATSAEGKLPPFPLVFPAGLGCRIAPCSSVSIPRPNPSRP